MLTAGEIAAMKAVQVEALPATCTIQRSSRSANSIGERVVSWSTASSGVACRLAREQRAAQRGSMSQQSVVIGPWVLTVATTVDIRSGDRVIVGGVTYEVVDAAAGPSWETARRCELKELEDG